MPHERTLAGPKADRLKLKRAARAHLSQVFGLYSDPERASDKPFEAIEKTAPLSAGRTSDGVEQKLWRLTDKDAQAEVVKLLADQKIYIADGHHRYETMLALRDELRAESANNPRSSIEYGTIFLANMDDPGLLVFPTHRVVHGLPGFDLRRRPRARQAVLRGHADAGGRRGGRARRARAARQGAPDVRARAPATATSITCRSCAT